MTWEPDGSSRTAAAWQCLNCVADGIASATLGEERLLGKKYRDAMASARSYASSALRAQAGASNFYMETVLAAAAPRDFAASASARGQASAAVALQELEVMVYDDTDDLFQHTSDDI